MLAVYVSGPRVRARDADRRGAAGGPRAGPGSADRGLDRGPGLPVRGGGRSAAHRAPGRLRRGPRPAGRAGHRRGRHRRGLAGVHARGGTGSWRREAAWLREAGARLVLGDIPPLAFEAASAGGAAVGRPSGTSRGTGSTATWPPASRRSPRRRPAPARRTGGRSSSCGCRSPATLRPSARVEDVPLVARRPAVAKGEARRRLGLDEGPARPAVVRRAWGCPA